MATFTPTSADVAGGDDALAAQYNELRDDLAAFLTAIWGSPSGETWTLTTAKLDVINEQTAAAGVTADGVLLKDSSATVINLTATTSVITDTIAEKTAAAGVTIDSVLLKDGNASVTNLTAATAVITDAVSEKTSAHGVMIDGVLLKDGAAAGAGNAQFASIVANYAIIVNGIELNNSGNGLSLSDNLDMNSHIIRGLNKTIDFLAGTIANGATIPLPTGFDQADCTWMAAARGIGTGSNSTAMCEFDVFWSGRAVTIRQRIFGGSGFTNGGNGSYVIIGLKNRI